jgi:sugar phosphate isomerase/epimerase
MRLGTSTSIFGKPFDPDGVLNALEQAEFGVIELFCNPGYYDPTDQRAAAALQCRLAESSVQVWSLHAPFSKNLDISLTADNERARAVKLDIATIELAGELGASLVVVHASSEPIDDEARSTRLAQARESLMELASAADQAGVRLAVELLPRSCLGNSPQELLELLQALPDQVGVCLDVNHVSHATLLPEAVHDLGRRILTLHLSDFDNIDERHWLPGEGTVDWRALRADLDSVSYEGPWLYEVHSRYHDHLADAAMLAGNFAAWKAPG